MSETARVLGIDLSGRTTGRTALAVVMGAADRVQVELVRSHGGARLPKRPALRGLAAIAVDLDVDLVAIDAPLTLPHTWTCEREDCHECFPADGDDPVYTVRDCERFEAWAEATPVRAHPMPTAMLGALAARGRYLRRAVEREGIATLETWPAGTLLQLAPRGAVKPSSSKDPGSYSRWARAQLQPHVTADWAAVEGPDDVDATAAAYAGWRHLTGTGCLHVGEPPICVAVSGSDGRA